jgi:hypothetical protein
LVGSAAGVWLRSPPFCLSTSCCGVLPALFIFAQRTSGFARRTRFRQKIIFPFGINVFLASMNLFHRAGTVAAKERISRSSGMSHWETKNNSAVKAPLNNQHTESNEEN